jgi:hypothetical protein
MHVNILNPSIDLYINSESHDLQELNIASFWELGVRFRYHVEHLFVLPLMLFLESDLMRHRDKVNVANKPNIMILTIALFGAKN